MSDHNTRQISLGTLLDWAAEDAPTFRVRTATDALPGGYSAAMAPVLVNWRMSNHREHGDADEYYIVRNVNLNGNPIEGVTNLCSVRIPACGVESAQYITVPLGAGGIQIGGHGMIRLVFKEGSRAQVLSQAAEPVPGESDIRDLVFSWEAWRPPGVHFSMKKGLDPNTFGLTMRCYTGAQRFLEDALQKRDWTCYPLTLPDAQRGLNELLYVALVMGDSMARHAITRLLDTADPAPGAAGETPADYPDAAQEEVKALQEALLENRAPENPVADMTGGKISYQLLERSCVTMALEIVAVAAHRLTARLPADRQVRVRVTPENIPPWVDDMAHAGMAGIFVRMPHVMWWLMHNANVFPTRAYRILDDAGLLAHDGRKVVKHHYKLFGETPYGKLVHNLLV
jgi:hypothetical protein